MDELEARWARAPDLNNLIYIYLVLLFPRTYFRFYLATIFCSELKGMFSVLFISNLLFGLYFGLYFALYFGVLFVVFRSFLLPLFRSLFLARAEIGRNNVLKTDRILLVHFSESIIKFDSFTIGNKIGNERKKERKKVLLLVSLWLSNHWSFKVNQLIRKIT